MNQRLAKAQTLFPEIDDVYKKHAEKNAYPGYAYGIVLDGQLVHSSCGGVLDVENKSPVTLQSMFRIASMTKSFTAMAILKLRDDGKLRLEDALELYIPEVPLQHLTKDAARITIRDLLVHSAGFPTDDPWADRKLAETEEYLINLLKNKVSFSNPAGTIFEYSNLGYALLGQLIKIITGISPQKFIEFTICRPLGIKCCWEYVEIPKDQLAHGYSYKNGICEEEPLLHDGVFGPMGGLITSIESFTKYIAFHQAAWPPRDDPETGPIRRSSIREMHQPHQFIKLETSFKYLCDNECSLITAYGYGLKWLRDSLGRIYIGHRGGLPGFGSNWLFLPDYGLGVVSFANCTYADTVKIDLDILNKLIVEAGLNKRLPPVSAALMDYQDKLLPHLPNWEKVTENIFADNFFLDRPVTAIRKESQELFAKIGKILAVGKVIPENQLRGTFVVQGEKAKIQVKFALSPEKPCKIQQIEFRLDY